MVALPGATPVINPVSEPAVATAVLLLLQRPPPAPLVNVVVWPTQVCSMPPIAVGAVFTVTIVVAVQPVPNVYVIVAVPGATPKVIPVEDPMVATPVVLLLQVPPPGQVSVPVVPTHMPVGPVIADTAVTVILRVTWQLPIA